MMIQSHGFRKAILVITALLLLFSCSSDRDKRKAVREDYGEPDEIIKSEYGGIRSELYIYTRRDINRAYEFRKTVSGCGGSGQWYVYRMYYADYLGYILYLPPTIVHTPIESTPPGKKVPISAVITDDEEVVSATLYYRTVGQEEFQSDRMTGGQEDAFTANIPSELVTVEGVEYFIEASDDAHISVLPENGYYEITVTSAEETVEEGSPETSLRIVPQSPPFEPGEAFENTSPFSP